MSSNVPTHIRRHFHSYVQTLRETVGREAARAYLKSLCSDASLDMLFASSDANMSSLERQPTSLAQVGEDLWSTFAHLDEERITDCVNIPDVGHTSVAYTKANSLLASDARHKDLLHIADNPNSVSPSSISSFGTSSLSSLTSPSVPSKSTTLCEACTCGRCRERKRRKERADNHNNSLDTVLRCFPRPRLLDFLSEYWETLGTNGLYYHESVQTFQWTVESIPVQVRRLHYHFILDHLDIEDDLYQWRRSIAEVNNLNGYEAFFAEAEDQLSGKKHTRETGETNSQKAHKEYLAYIYADRIPKNFDKSKRAFKKNLEHGRRWAILVDGYIGEDDVVVPGLGPGVLLLSGPSIKKKM